MTNEDKQRIAEQFRVRREGFREHRERVETSLLNAFEQWASANEALPPPPAN